MKISYSILLQIGVLIACFSIGQASAQGVLKVEGEAPIKITVDLEPKPPTVKTCQANVATEYLQFNTRARVDLTLENPDCGASNGEYTIRIRIKDENGELISIEHPETWARSDDAPIETQETYDIGNNVELIRVSTTRLTCVCDEVGPNDDGS